MNKSFIDEFNLEVKSNHYDSVSDYETFSNKVLLDKLRNTIIQNLIDNQISNQPNIEEFVKRQIDQTLEGYDLSVLERSYIYNLIDNEINGFGPLTELLDDKSITEIMVNGPKDIYIELDGKLIKDETISFINNDHIVRTIQRLIQPIGRTIDTSNPMVDARLSDGSRLNAVIPPLSLSIYDYPICKADTCTPLCFLFMRRPARISQRKIDTRR